MINTVKYYINIFILFSGKYYIMLERIIFLFEKIIIF
jgi:hypothetical protein